MDEVKMKQSFISYFQRVGMTDKPIERVYDIFEVFSKLYPGEQIEDVLVTEYTNEDGSRVYENIIFFTGGGLMLGSDSFLTKDAFDTMDLNSNIAFWKTE